MPIAIAGAGGVLVFLFAGGALLMGLALLGAETGVIAMCSTAPEWWAQTLTVLMLTVPSIGGGYAGWRTARWLAA